MKVQQRGAPPPWVQAAAEGRYGDVVRSARAAMGLDMEAGARYLGYSRTTLLRIESGARPLDSVTELRRLARLLGVSPALFGLLAEPASVLADEETNPVRRREFLAGAAGALATSVPLLVPLQDALLHGAPPTEHTPTSAQVRALTAVCRADFAGCRYRELGHRIPSLLALAQTAAQQAPPTGYHTAQGDLSSAYLVGASFAICLWDQNMAAFCVDRCLSAARASADPLRLALAQQEMAILLRREPRNQDAAVQWISEVASAGQRTLDPALPGAQSMQSSLLLTGAYTAALAGRPTEALAMLDHARDHAADVGPRRVVDDEDARISHLLGPHVASYTVSVHSVLGDYDQALRAADRVNPAALPTVERQVRFYRDHAEAALAAGNRDLAADRFGRALRIAPQVTRYRHWAQTLAAQLAA